MKSKRGKYDPEETRRRLLEAAMEEIYLHGFRSASMDQILKRAEVTKGALYHHFKNKNELGYAVVDELVSEMVMDQWKDAFEEQDDPMAALMNAIQCVDISDEEILLGCPLNNLANEMAPINETFRELVEGIFVKWRAQFKEILDRSKANGYLKPEVNTTEVAAFMVGVMEGAASTVKSSRDRNLLEMMTKNLVGYLEMLRQKVPVAS